MLLIDTNVLARCSRGRAMDRLEILRRAPVNLGTTNRNTDELCRILNTVFGLGDDEAADECRRVTTAMHIIPADFYDDRRMEAAQRLTVGGQSDWPLLAAALALDGQIWSDDRDFFGVGVPIWHSDNVLFYAPSPA